MTDEKRGRGQRGAPRAPYFIAIPAGTPPSKCRGCEMVIYFCTHPRTSRVHPVSVAHEDAVLPTVTTAGRGISHFADCPEAERFRTRAKEQQK